jgi:hypothetical protein
MARKNNPETPEKILMTPVYGLAGPHFTMAQAVFNQ